MYRAPVGEIAFTLKHVAGLSGALEEGRFPDLSEDLVDAILEEAGRFASEEVAPLNEAGDSHGAVLKDGAVTMPPGWKELYARLPDLPNTADRACRPCWVSPRWKCGTPRR
jgi:acyl-CoA dehydrogenase